MNNPISSTGNTHQHRVRLSKRPTKNKPRPTMNHEELTLSQCFSFTKDYTYGLKVKLRAIFTAVAEISQ